MALPKPVPGLVIRCSYLWAGEYGRGQEEGIKAQWAQVENQLQRRNDLIPNLVETVKGTAAQERDVFGQIADSRAKLAGARTPEETAVSIAAELIQLRWGGTGRALTETDGRIHHETVHA